MPTRDSAYCCAVKRKTCRRRLLHVKFVLFIGLAAFIAAAWAQPSHKHLPRRQLPPKQRASARPSWSELTSAQREALAPLAGMWETLEADRKKKWLEMAARFPGLTPDAQKRMHERMGEYARLSPEQRKTARENFRQAYELPADQRQEKLQRYQQLPDEKKRALAEQAAKKQSEPTPAPTPPATVAPPAPTK